MTQSIHRVPATFHWWRVAGWALVATALVAPLIAMRFTAEVNWTPSDFLVAALILGGAGMLLELTMRRVRDARRRAGIALAVAIAAAILWINGAVGIIGRPDNPLNQLYPALVVIGVAAAILTWRRPGALARIFGAAGAAMIVLGAVAVTVAGDQPPGMAGLIVLHLVPGATLGAAALLVRQPAHRPA